MSKGSLLCSLVVVQLCIVQLCVISSSWQLTPTAAGGELLCQDRIGRPPRFMSSHGRDDREELGGHSGDSIFDEEEELGEGAAASEEEEEGWMPDDDDGGGGSGAAKGSSSGSGGGGDVECPECGKFFKNDKSMFGHLRSHPNRGYRGATPPVNKLRLSPETAAAASASPSSSSPSRGTHHHQPRPQRDRRLIALELISPYALLTLQCRENSDQAAPPPPPPPPPPRFRGQTEGGSGGGQISSSTLVAAGARADNGYSCSVLKIPKKRRNMPKEISDARRKKAKLVPPPPPPQKEKGGPYICKHCYAEFPTHQALGGHMAAHHKKVPTTPNDASSSRAHQGMAAQSQDGNSTLKVEGGGDDDDGCRDSGLPPRRGLLSDQLSMASNMPRQSSLQASGSGRQMIGMRPHESRRRRSNGLTLAAPAPAPAPAPTPTQEDDRGGRRLLNIDLNAEAAEQE